MNRKETSRETLKGTFTGMSESGEASEKALNQLPTCSATLTLALSREMESESEKLKANGMH